VDSFKCLEKIKIRNNSDRNIHPVLRLIFFVRINEKEKEEKIGIT